MAAALALRKPSRTATLLQSHSLTLTARTSSIPLSSIFTHSDSRRDLATTTTTALSNPTLVHTLHPSPLTLDGLRYPLQPTIPPSRLHIATPSHPHRRALLIPPHCSPSNALMSWLGTNSLRHRRGSSASSAGPAARPRRRRSTKTFQQNVRSFSSPRTVIREAFKRFGEHCARNQVRSRSPNALSFSAESVIRDSIQLD